MGRFWGGRKSAQKPRSYRTKTSYLGLRKGGGRGNHLHLPRTKKPTVEISTKGPASELSHKKGGQCAGSLQNSKAELWETHHTGKAQINSTRKEEVFTAGLVGNQNGKKGEPMSEEGISRESISIPQRGEGERLLRFRKSVVEATIQKKILRTQSSGSPAEGSGQRRWPRREGKGTVLSSLRGGGGIPSKESSSRKPCREGKASAFHCQLATRREDCSWEKKASCCGNSEILRRKESRLASRERSAFAERRNTT